jgi:leucyl aminopeptidase
MTPTILANETKKIFKGIKKIKIKILEDSETKKLKMGLYNSVGMGSVEKSKFIIVEYLAGKKSEKPIILIGKGVTFDNGGNNLKPDGGKSMQMDMTGGATVLGALYSIAKLGLKKNVVVLVPAVENLLSGAATKTGDIITSMSGKTVKINNTDAEGRLVLADAITYSKKYNPEYIIDVATLTGAALMAVGQRASIVMSNNLDMENNIRNFGEKVGDYF